MRRRMVLLATVAALAMALTGAARAAMPVGMFFPERPWCGSGSPDVPCRADAVHHLLSSDGSLLVTVGRAGARMAVFRLAPGDGGVPTRTLLHCYDATDASCDAPPAALAAAYAAEVSSGGDRLYLQSTSGRVDAFTISGAGVVASLAGAGSCAAPGGLGGCLALPATSGGLGIDLSPDGHHLVVAIGRGSPAVASLLVGGGGALSIPSGTWCVAGVELAGCATPTALAGVRTLVAAVSDDRIAVLGRDPGGVLATYRLDAAGVIGAASGCIAEPVGSTGCAPGRRVDLEVSVGISPTGADVAVAGPAGVALMHRDGGGAYAQADGAAGCIAPAGGCSSGEPGASETGSVGFGGDGRTLVAAAGGEVVEATLADDGTPTVFPTYGYLRADEIAVASGATAWAAADVYPDSSYVLVGQLPPACGSAPSIDVHWRTRSRSAPVTPCSDPNGDPMTLEVVRRPASGAVEIGADGSVTYIVLTDLAHDDGFDVRAGDGIGWSSETTVAVHPTNRRPRCKGGAARSYVGAGALFEVPCTDPDGDPVTMTAAMYGAAARLVSSGGGVVRFEGIRVGDATLGGLASDGSVSTAWAAPVRVLSPPAPPTPDPGQPEVSGGGIQHLGRIGGIPTWITFSYVLHASSRYDGVYRTGKLELDALTTAGPAYHRLVAATVDGGWLQYRYHARENALLRLRALPTAPTLEHPVGVPDVHGPSVRLLVGCSILEGGHLDGSDVVLDGVVACPRATGRGDHVLVRVPAGRGWRTTRTLPLAKGRYHVRMPLPGPRFRLQFQPVDPRRIVPTYLELRVARARARGATGLLARGGSRPVLP